MVGLPRNGRNGVTISRNYPFYRLLLLEEIGINAGNWVDSAQDRNYWRTLVNPALKLRVP